MDQCENLASSKNALKGDYKSGNSMIQAHHWQELKLIVANALERESTRERIDFVRQSCADDTELSQAAEYLLDKPEIFSAHENDELEDFARRARVGDPEVGR